jgi:hypothetical protein
MYINSLLRKFPRELRSRTAGILLAAGSAFVVSLPPAALAQTQPLCGPEVKDEVLKALAAVEDASDAEKIAVESAVYERFQYCASEPQQPILSTFYIAARQCSASVTQLGSLFYEEMSCCGYDPQRRQFACPVKIKQPFGFGGSPLPGSREHVLHCVADANGILQPVGHDSVHLSDSEQRPPWQFAVIANANDNLHTIQPMNGETRRARSILSWALPPRHCDYKPIWGNALNYPIRLDQ